MTVKSAWRLSWPLVIGLLLFAIFLAVGGQSLLSDPDTQWHIAIGNWILKNGTVPKVDHHSHTFMDHPWIAKEWLSQIALALAFKAGGWDGVALLAAAAIAGTFALMQRLLLRYLAPLPAAVFTTAAIVMSAPHFLARPHLLAFPLLLLWAAGLVSAVEDRRPPRSLLLLVMVVWANLHGGFTLGLALCAAFALEAVVTAQDRRERWTTLIGWTRFGLGAALAACATPYGWESILVTGRIFDIGGALPLIDEWRSPDFHKQSAQAVILLTGLFAAFAAGLRLPIARAAILAGLVMLYLKYARNAEILATVGPLALAPFLARQWPALRPNRARWIAFGHPAGRWAVLAVLVVGVAAGGDALRRGMTSPPKDVAPSAALAYARQAGLNGAVFNDYGFGGYLILEGIPTFIDGRGELYGGKFIATYSDAVTLRGKTPATDLLDRYHVEWTLLRNDRPLNCLLDHSPGWRRVYSDVTATIFTRVSPL